MTNKLFVGNISWRATEDQLKEVFSQVGTVLDVKIIYDKVKNRSKGFGFVTMSTPEEAQKAIEELNAKAEVDGRVIYVSEAKPQKEERD